MKKYLAVAVVMLVLGCVQQADNASYTPAPVLAAKGDRVYVDYTGTLEDGTVFDTSEGRAPLEFDAGSGQMIGGFDSAVIGMRVGEEKNVTIMPEDAYGMPDPANIIEVPLAEVPEGTEIGDTLYAGTYQVTVVDIRDDTVVIDANHPLAGKTLIFRIRMVRIEKKS